MYFYRAAEVRDCGASGPERCTRLIHLENEASTLEASEDSASYI